MAVKDYLKALIGNYNKKKANVYKISVEQRNEGNLAVFAVLRRKDKYDRISLDVLLNNKLTPRLILDDREKFYYLKNGEEMNGIIIKKIKEINDQYLRKLSGELKDYNFLEFFEKCIDKPTSEGGLRAEGTKKNWRRALKHLRTFLKNTYDLEDIDFDKISYSFFANLHSFIVNNYKQYSANTLWSIIKKFVKYAVIEDRIKDANILLKIQSELSIKRPTIERTEDDFLSIFELEKMANTPYYERYRTPFIFNCYVGLRISDLKRLTWSNFNKDFTEINIIEKKTKKLHKTPLHEFPSNILQDLFLKRKPDNLLIFDLPLDDSKTNKHLRRWAELAGISKNVISSHIMRRTFLNLLEWSGVPVSVASKINNHSSSRITEQYYHAKDQNLMRKELEKLPPLTGTIFNK